MKVMERVEEKANTRKKVEGHSLKFKHRKSKSSSNIYFDFKVKSRALLEAIFGKSIYILQFEKSEVQRFK